MALTDFVQRTLDYLDTQANGGNWNTTTYSPHPTLIDGDEMRDNSDDSRARAVDVVNTNVITVDSSPAGTNEPIGTDYDHRIRRGVGVSIEGYHQDGGGQITDKDDFDNLVSEARKAILTERTFPSNTTGIKDLMIEEENDLSPPSDPNDADYFRYTFDVWFEGYENLP